MENIWINLHGHRNSVIGCLCVWNGRVYVCIYIHIDICIYTSPFKTHIHTHIYIYIYMLLVPMIHKC